MIAGNGNRWHAAGVVLRDHYVMLKPQVVQILAGSAEDFITQVHVGRTFNMSGAVPRLGPDVPRWFGETIGFWDGAALITWTSNIQAWISHGGFEFSNRFYRLRQRGQGPRQLAALRFRRVTHG